MICWTSWWRSCTRESACPHRIRPVRTLLENQRDNLLAFAVELDRELAALAQEWQISVTTAREVLQVQSLPTWDPKRWRREAALRATLRRPRRQERLAQLDPWIISPPRRFCRELTEGEGFLLPFLRHALSCAR